MISEDGGEAVLKVTGSRGISLNVSAEAAEATAMYSANGASNNINTANGDISITAASASTAYAMNSEDGLNAVSAGAKGNITVRAEGQAAAMGLMVGESGVNRISATGGNILVEAVSAGSAMGAASFGGLNELGAKASGLVTLRAEGGRDAVAAAAYVANAQNTLSAVNGGIVVEAASSGGSAKGLLANGGTNSATATGIGTISVTAEGYGKATALDATSGGVNALQSKSGDISVAAEVAAADGKAYGMFASGGGQNTVTTGTGAISVTIVAQAGALENSWAMFARDGGSNIITANSTAAKMSRIDIDGGMFADKGGLNSITTGAGADVVTVTGGMLAANADEAAGVGRNVISTGKGSDVVNISGGVGTQGAGAYAGQNLVNTGAGDDVIRLAVTGAIGVGSLIIQAGAGHDILTLVADSAAAFREFYQDWLTDLFANVKDNSIEEITVEGVDASELGWLARLCADNGVELAGYTESGIDVLTAALAGTAALPDAPGEDNDAMITDGDDLFAAHNLARMADSGLAPEAAEQEVLVFAAPEALTSELMPADDQGLFAVPADLLGDMQAEETLDALLASVQSPDSVPAGEIAGQSELETALAATADILLPVADGGHDDMVQLVQGAFIA